MEEINTRHLRWLKGCLSSMGRNSMINVASKCPELESTNNCFHQHPPCPDFSAFGQATELGAPFSAGGRTGKACTLRHDLLQQTHYFNGDHFQLFIFFFPPDKYVSPSLKFGSKSIVWICHTPCSLCPRCSQTLSTLSRLQHHEPLHILYWFLGIHSFTLTGSQHMSNLSCIAPSSSVSSKELRFAWTC